MKLRKELIIIKNNPSIKQEKIATFINKSLTTVKNIWMKCKKKA